MWYLYIPRTDQGVTVEVLKKKQKQNSNEPDIVLAVIYFLKCFMAALKYKVAKSSLPLGENDESKAELFPWCDVFACS